MLMANEINTGIVKVTLDPNTVSGQVGIPVRVQGLQGPIGPEGPQGPKGDKGETPIWVGETAPTDEEYVIWLDPNGEETDIVNSVNGVTGRVVIEMRHIELSNTDVLDIWENIDI